MSAIEGRPLYLLLSSELSSAKLFRDSIHRWLDASNSSTSFQGSKVKDEDTDVLGTAIISLFVDHSYSHTCRYNYAL